MDAVNRMSFGTGMNDFPFGLPPEIIWSLDETEEWDDVTYRLLEEEFSRRGKLSPEKLSGEDRRRKIRRLVVEYNDDSLGEDSVTDLHEEDLAEYRSQHDGWEWVLHDPENLLSPAQHFTWLMEQWERRPNGPTPEDDDESPTVDETEVWYRHWKRNGTTTPPEFPPYFEWAWTDAVPRDSDSR